MSITFNSIPTNIRTNGQFIEFSSARALQGLPVLPSRALIVAPRLSSGGQPAATPFLITSGPAGQAAFGYGSIGSKMAQAFVNANPTTELWGIGVADAGGGAAATGLVTITGTATAAGVLALYIGGEYVPVAVNVGDTASVVGANLVLALNATPGFESPVSGSNASGVVTITALNKGTTGNGIDLRLNYNSGGNTTGDTTPPGLTVVITSMASGATDGDIAGAITAMGPTQYNSIASGWNTSAALTLFEAELLNRWGPMEQIEGIVFSAIAGSTGTMASFGTARNSFCSSVMGMGTSPTPPFMWAAVAAGVAAFQYSINPFRQFNTLLLPGILPPAKAAHIVRTDQNTLLFDGISTYNVDQAGNCTIQRLITTYQTTNGVADASYLDITTPRGLAALRYTQRSRIALKFPRSLLAADGTEFGPEVPIVTPSLIKSELIALFIEWIAAGWVQGLAQFKADLIVQINETDPTRVDVLQDPNIVSNFMVYAAQVQFLLQTPAVSAAG